MISKYRIGRISAVLVGSGGGLMVALCLWLGASAVVGTAGFLAQAMLPQLPLVALAGLSLVLFATVAWAIFDLADRKS